MKINILLLVTLFLSLLKIVNADEYKMEMYFSNKFSTINFPDNNKFIDIDTSAVWKDSNGDYGSTKCFGRILEDKKIGSSLDLFCEAINQNKKKFWFRMERKSDQTDAGIGTTTYLYGEGKYKNFVDKKCIYASKVFGPNAIVNQKCNIN